jgi:hypothetical protein
MRWRPHRRAAARGRLQLRLARLIGVALTATIVPSVIYKLGRGGCRLRPKAVHSGEGWGQCQLRLGSPHACSVACMSCLVLLRITNSLHCTHSGPNRYPSLCACSCRRCSSPLPCSHSRILSRVLEAVIEHPAGTERATDPLKRPPAARPRLVVALGRQYQSWPTQKSFILFSKSLYTPMRGSGSSAHQQRQRAVFASCSHR